MTDYVCANRRLVENGIVYNKGDVVLPELVSYDRLVYLIARDVILPVGGLDALDEELFTDVMEIRD